MLKVQEFIKANGIMALADAPLNIKVREYPEQGYFMLNYDQIESPKNNEITIECRSLIVDKDGNVISRSFDRFFNYGEMPEFYTDFDINRSIVAEKADGSLIKVYFSPATNRWEISTRSQAFGEGPHAIGGVFRDWVLRAMGLTELEFQGAMVLFEQDVTLIMEYTGPENRIVTPYEKSEMVMLAVRNNVSGSYEDAQHYVDLLVGYGMNIRMAHEYKLETFDDILKAARDLPTLTEGYVVYDPVSGKRVKIKNPSYVAVHHLRENGVPSIKRIFALVLENEQDEYLSYFEQDRPLFEPVIAEVEAYRQALMRNWETVKHIEDQKEFALAVQKFKGTPFFFNAKKAKTSAVHEFDEAPVEKKIKQFNVKAAVEITE